MLDWKGWDGAVLLNSNPVRIQRRKLREMFLLLLDAGWLRPEDEDDFLLQFDSGLDSLNKPSRN